MAQPDSQAAQAEPQLPRPLTSRLARKNERVCRDRHVWQARAVDPRHRLAAGPDRVQEEIVVVARSEDVPTLPVPEREFDSRQATGTKIAVEKVVENTVIAKAVAGVDRPGGEIICFMDDDAAARPDWLERIVGWYADASVPFPLRERESSSRSARTWPSRRVTSWG